MTITSRPLGRVPGPQKLHNVSLRIALADGTAVEIVRRLSQDRGSQVSPDHELVQGMCGFGFWEGETFYPWHVIVRIETLAITPLAR